MLRVLTVLFALFFATAVPAAAERVVTVNFTTAILTVTDNGRELLRSSVVLPAGNYYTVPTTARVTLNEMYPPWTPTANTRRDNPGKYKAHYAPGEKGNAMGDCKISMLFANQARESILRGVRIHGAARQQDLGRRLSRSCVRVPNSLCEQLVRYARPGTLVRFVR